MKQLTISGEISTLSDNIDPRYAYLVDGNPINVKHLYLTNRTPGLYNNTDNLVRPDKEKIYDYVAAKDFTVQGKSYAGYSIQKGMQDNKAYYFKKSVLTHYSPVNFGLRDPAGASILSDYSGPNNLKTTYTKRIT